MQAKKKKILHELSPKTIGFTVLQLILVLQNIQSGNNG